MSTTLLSAKSASGLLLWLTLLLLHISRYHTLVIALKVEDLWLISFPGKVLVGTAPQSRRDANIVVVVIYIYIAKALA